MARLANSIDDLKPHYDVVVVGSGYGGGITASRMARAGKAVCLLERGREFQPGEYPDRLEKAEEEMQIDTPAGRIGSKTGLYDFRVNDDMNVFLGCGLGGTSLVNANVSLRPDPRVFEDPLWPAEIRGEAGVNGSDLEKGYERALKMLNPKKYPPDPPYPVPHKMEALELSAKSMTTVHERVPINVTFEDGVNQSGVMQQACTGCGDCVTGCNYRAKNTIIMNYLPDAKNFNCEIFTETAVRHLQLEKQEDGNDQWVVYFERRDAGREEFEAPDLTVRADVVVLSAGTLGSTEILLRSRDNGLSVSDRLGARFSGNGDVLAFGYNTAYEINAVGTGHSTPSKNNLVGPCITGRINLSDPEKPLAQGMTLEEGSIPGAIGALMPGMLAAAAGLEKTVAVAAGAEGAAGRQRMTWKQELRQTESLLLGPHHGAVRNTQVYLVMTHDDSDGTLKLENDRLRINWRGVGDKPIFKDVDLRLRQATAALNGIHVSDPLWSKMLNDSLVTVHPLGGCAMGKDAGEAVVNHKGQVFASNVGTEVHDGLYVSDGAVIPRSLGTNPLLTISALAERCCTLLAADRHWNIDYDAPSIPKPEPQPTLGIQFTERMAGFFSHAVRDKNYQLGYDQAKSDDNPLEFVLTITVDNLDAMLADPEHNARVAGTVKAPLLSNSPLMVSEGKFQLFAPDSNSPELKIMSYRMKLNSADGHTWFFEGHKLIHDAPATRSWAETTTLYTTVYEGADENSAVFGCGILRISPNDFARQLTTMKAVNANSFGLRLSAVARFGRFFAGVLFEQYGGIAAPLKFFDESAPPRLKRPLRTCAPEVHDFNALDGVALKLTRYQGGKKGPVILSHGLGVSSLIFSIDTIGTNLLEYLYAHEFDVWLLDYRASIDLKASKGQFTGDDIALKDYPAAIQKALEVTEAKDLQMVVHCFGATTFFMAMLGQELKGVRSVVCSQTATDIVAPLPTRIKCGLHVPGVLDLLGIDSLTTSAYKGEKWYETLYDDALRLYPVGERCRNPVCARMTFMYAPLYKHENLNDLTHDCMHEMFGIASMHAFEHLALLTRTGHLVDQTGKEVYLNHLQRLRVPICFIHGAENQCFLPESTERTVKRLASVNGPGLYSRHVIPGYGHIDCIYGKNAYKDVYPLVLEHLLKTS
jgi:cholesterol oxidase